MKFPSVSYDEAADVLYVQLAAGAVHQTVSLGDLRMIDEANDGTVLGVEFVSASDGVDLANVPFADTIATAIGDSGLPIRAYA